MLEVVIDKGMQNGEKIKFRGMSDEHPNCEPGDILFILQEKEHPVFARKNDDLLVRKEVTLVEALCGFKFVLTHLDDRKVVISSKPGEILKPYSGPNVRASPPSQSPLLFIRASFVCIPGRALRKMRPR